MKLAYTNSSLILPAWSSAFLVIFTGFMFQAFLVSYTFPAYELLTATPLSYVDNAHHWYALSMSKHLFSQSSSIIYDPHFNAGIPFAFSTDASTNLAELMYIVLQDYFTEIQTWKIYVFLASVFGPILPAVGLKIIRLNTGRILLGTILSFFVWWISWFHYFTTHGMVSYVLGSFFAFFVICLVLRYRDEPSLGKTIIVGCCGAVMILIHPLSVFPVFFLLSAYLACNLGRVLDWRFMLFLSGFALLSVGLNSWWLLNKFSPVFDQGFFIVSYQSAVRPQNLILELMGTWGKHVHGARVYPLLFLLSVIGLLNSRTEERRTWIYPFLIAWGGLQIYAYTASIIPMLAKLTEPNRHAPAGYLLLIVPATFALPVVFSRTGSGELMKRKLAGLSAYGLSLLIFLFCGYEFIREVTYGKHGRYASSPPRVSPLGEYSDFVLSSLANQTDTSARVLFETSKGRVHDRGHFAGYYAYESNREFIGGPYTFRYFAGFWDGFVFGRPIGEIPQEQFLDYMDLYNIGWVIAHFDESKDYFEALDEIEFIASYKEVAFYRVNREHSFFVEGSGQVNTEKVNKIELTELEGKEVVLKYHYIPGLSSSPAADIQPIYLQDDPLPFIQINNPAPNLTLYLEH